MVSSHNMSLTNYLIPTSNVATCVGFFCAGLLDDPNNPSNSNLTPLLLGGLPLASRAGLSIKDEYTLSGREWSFMDPPVLQFGLTFTLGMGCYALGSAIRSSF